jgi:pre-rRNA-processing protein TSR1
MEVEPTVLAEPDPSDADSLVSSNDPDDIGNEQTWPTEEEMQGPNAVPQPADGVLPDATVGTTPKTVKRIPKGMSEYQAAWIIDEEDDDNDEGEIVDDGSEAGMEDIDDEEMVDMPIHADGDEIELEGRKSVAFQDLDAEEEEKQ